MRDGSEIQKLLNSIENLSRAVQANKGNWRDVWDEIKNTGQAFKESRFPSPAERQEAWNRFQSLIDKVKECQEQAKNEAEKRFRDAERHLDQIRSFAYKATPSSESSEVILALLTGGLSVAIKAGVEAILGPCAYSGQNELQFRNREH